MRLIDADALKKHYAWWEDDRQKLFDSIVDSQPTVDAVPVVHGHWIEHEEMLWDENTSAPYYKCSECGYDTRHDTPYCPMCGSRMDEERGSDHAEEEIL